MDCNRDTGVLSENFKHILLVYLSNLIPGLRFRSEKDLVSLSSRQLLQLAQKVEDEILGAFVHLLKSADFQENLFEKLMGDHEEENRELVNEFFERYQKMVMSDYEIKEHFNPLEVYIPPHTFDDLAFIQSRQPFFLRQNIDTINEFLKNATDLKKTFGPGEAGKGLEPFLVIRNKYLNSMIDMLHPDFLNNNSSEQEQKESESITSTKPKKAPNFKVVLFNDEQHTYDYVVEMLTKVCQLAKNSAFRCAVEVDMTGKTIVYYGTKDECEDVCLKILNYGADHRIPESMGSMEAEVQAY